MNPDQVIELSDETICVTTGQDQKSTLLWIDLFEKNGVRTK